MEWDQTAKGVETFGKSVSSSLGSYFKARSAGTFKSSKAFFSTDLSAVSTAAIQSALKEVTSSFASAAVNQTENGMQIKDFCIKHWTTYQAGNGYYELTKPEDIQAAKQVVVENVHSGKRYGGPDARAVLGLSASGEIRVRPGDHGAFRIFVQSTSVNRKLVSGTTVLYYVGASQHA